MNENEEALGHFVESVMSTLDIFIQAHEVARQRDGEYLLFTPVGISRINPINIRKDGTDYLILEFNDRWDSKFLPQIGVPLILLLSMENPILIMYTGVYTKQDTKYLMYFKYEEIKKNDKVAPNAGSQTDKGSSS